MATNKQVAAVEKMVELAQNTGGRVSVSKAMRESNIPYSEKTAKNPKKLTTSKGFRQIYLKAGLTEGFITKALVEDIKNKPKNRLGELRLGSEILQMTKTEGTKDEKTLIINISGESAKRYGIIPSQDTEDGSIRPS